jgi:hypothetical protein
MSEAQTQAADLADEQAADLAALTAAANPKPAPGLQSQQPVEESNEPAPPSAEAMALAGMAVGILKPLVCFAVPVLKDAPAELWQPIPEGVAAVVDHYGGGPAWMNSPWARLGFSLMPLVGYAAVQAMNKPAEPEPMALEAPPPAADVGQRTVTFGANDANGAQLG